MRGPGGGKRRRRPTRGPRPRRAAALHVPPGDPGALATALGRLLARADLGRHRELRRPVQTSGRGSARPAGAGCSSASPGSAAPPASSSSTARVIAEHAEQTGAPAGRSGNPRETNGHADGPLQPARGPPG